MERKEPATNKAKLLRAAADEKGLSLSVIAKKVYERFGVKISPSEAGFALSGRMGKQTYHGMMGTRVSRLIAQVLRVPVAELDRAHQQDMEERMHRAAVATLFESVGEITPQEKAEITKAIRKGASLDEAVAKHVKQDEDEGNSKLA